MCYDVYHPHLNKIETHYAFRPHLLRRYALAYTADGLVSLYKLFPVKIKDLYQFPFQNVKGNRCGSS